MKKILFYTFAVMAVMLASCGGNKGLESVLETVPKDTKGLAIADLNNINEKLKSEGEVTLQDLLMRSFGSEMNRVGKALLGEDSPIDFNAPAIFFESNEEPVFTFFVKGEKDFINFLEEEADMKLKERDGMYVDSDKVVFLSGNQAWVCPSGNLKVSDIRKFKELKKEKSFMSLKVAPKLLEGESDIMTYVNLSELGMIRDMEVSQAVSMLNLVFDDPKYAVSRMNFDTGKFVADLNVFNTKGEPAECAMHPAKIDLPSLNSFPGKGDVFGAIGIDSRLMGQITSKMQAFAPKEALDAINNIDGNIVFSLDISSAIEYNNRRYSYYDDYDYDYGYGEEIISFEGDSVMYAVEAIDETIGDLEDIVLTRTKKYDGPKFAVQVSYKNAADAGKVASQFQDLIKSEGYTMEVLGNKIYIAGGSPSGVSISTVSNEFEGASAGIAFVMEKISDPKVQMLSDYIKGAFLVWKGDNNDLSLQFTIDTKEGVNSLVTFMKLGSVASKM